VALHSWGGSAQETLFNNGGRGHFYSFAVTERGWLLLAPDLSRVDLPWHVAVLDVQHRLMELVNKVRSEYAVDGSRIYIIGISGGGYRAVLMAEKYPDFFAAAVDVKGPTKLVDWFWDDQSGESDICDGNHRYWLCDDTYGPPVGVTGGPPYERYSCLFSGRDGLVGNLRHVPVAILHNTGWDSPNYSIVPIDHARDLNAAIESWKPDQPPFYREYPGDHNANPSPELQAELMDWLANQRLDLDTPPLDLEIKTDESKAYYWLAVTQQPRLNSLSDNPWTAVSVEYDPVWGSIAAAVTDTQRVTLTFDLAWMGLDAVNEWVVEERELPSGQLDPGVVQPLNGLLTVSVSGSDQHHLYMYPKTANRHVSILKQGLDTYLDAWYPSSRRSQAPALWLRKDGVYSPLLKFSLGDIPAGARILSAALRLYVSAALDNPPANLNVWAYRVNREWVGSEASYDQARAGVNWAQPGCNASPADREASASSTLAIPGAGTWCSFGVTAVMQDWVDGPPASNQGLILKCDGYLSPGYYQFASQEYPDASKRPELVVIYES
jgi:pimeloyl-ACP methyl ester carboxylesterase